jgi:hypothetical protein
MATDPHEKPTEKLADGSGREAPESRTAAERDTGSPPEPPRNRGYPPRPKR